MVKRIIVILVIALALVISDLITLVRIDSCPDEHLPELIGFPFAYRTSIPWVNSFTGVLYAGGLILDWIVWMVVVLVTEQGYLRLIRGQRTRKTILWILFICSVMIIAIFSMVDWSVHWMPDLPFQCLDTKMRTFYFGE